MDGMGKLRRFGLAATALMAIAAATSAHASSVDESAVFGYPIGGAKMQVVTGEAILAEVPLRVVEGNSTVDEHGEGIASGLLTAKTEHGSYTVRYSVAGRAGQELATYASVNGVNRAAVVRIASKNECVMAPCSGAVRIHVDGENWTDLEIYLPGSEAR